MITKPIKIILLVILAIIFVLVAVYAYRVFLMFSTAKVKAYATDEANKTTAPDVAYKMIIEAVAHIIKSPELTAQVKQLSTVDSIEPEKALVLTAVKNCQASGMIATPTTETTQTA